MRIIPEKKKENEKKKIRTINLWKGLHRKLKEIKKKTGRCMSEMIRECLCNPVNINDIARQEGVEIKLDPLDGMKIMSVNLSGETIQKMNEIKEIIPIFSGSVVVNLCLIFSSLTINFILQNIKDQKEDKKGKEGEN
ncbi:MAG: hypothetical protein ACKKMO_00715 [Candidatus Nealsonbacteria bacterium]